MRALTQQQQKRGRQQRKMVRIFIFLFIMRYLEFRAFIYIRISFSWMGASVNWK